MSQLQSYSNQQYEEAQVQIQLSPVQRAILDRILALSIQENISKKQQKKGLPLSIRKQIPNMKMTKSSQKCSICVQDFCQGQIIKKFPCKHIFHRNCAKEWLKISAHCPNCRFDLKQYYENISNSNQQKGGDNGNIDSNNCKNIDNGKISKKQKGKINEIINGNLCKKQKNCIKNLNKKPIKQEQIGKVVQMAC